jgi:hypothetical protein
LFCPSLGVGTPCLGKVDLASVGPPNSSRGSPKTFRLNREIHTDSICYPTNDAEPLLEVAHQVKLSSDRYRPLFLTPTHASQRSGVHFIRPMQVYIGRARSLRMAADTFSTTLQAVLSPAMSRSTAREEISWLRWRRMRWLYLAETAHC